MEFFNFISSLLNLIVIHLCFSERLSEKYIYKYLFSLLMLIHKPHLMRINIAKGRHRRWYFLPGLPDGNGSGNYHGKLPPHTVRFCIQCYCIFCENNMNTTIGISGNLGYKSKFCKEPFQMGKTVVIKNTSILTHSFIGWIAFGTRGLF